MLTKTVHRIRVFTKELLGSNTLIDHLQVKY